MIIDNSWVIEKKKEQSLNSFIYNILKKDNLTYYISLGDSNHQLTILPKNWLYPINWLFHRYYMYLNTKYHTLTIWDFRYKDAAINLIKELEKRDSIQYSLRNMSSKEIQA